LDDLYFALMNNRKTSPVYELSTRLSTDFNIKLGHIENWQEHELEQLHSHIQILATLLGGRGGFIQQIGEITLEKSTTGTSLGLAYINKIQLSAAAPFSAWTIIHEIAHIWDAKNHWDFSTALEKSTNGFTSKKLSALKRFASLNWDAGKLGPQKKPGFYGRKPGSNAAGYFYGDRPSGSNWNFNRREDFSESVAMYCGWEHENELTRTAHGRIERYLLANGSKDPIYGIADNWSDYADFFYPKNGDYTTTKRWQFIHELIQTKKKSTNNF
jgi:hypothetical protein